MTASERWVARRAKGTTWLSLIGGLFGPAILIYIAVESPASKAYTMVALAIVVFLAAVMWWERTGFKRLLARRDAELQETRSGGGSV
jgi:hypothetical protein